MYGIVMQSEGYIWVQSEYKKGTTFKLYFPQSEEKEKQQENDPQKQESNGGHETILLVEDEEAVRKITKEVLKKYGYAVIDAGSGIEALQKTHIHIDLLVTDVVMPEMNGKELSEKLLELIPGLKILFMSGYMDDTILHHGVLDEGVSFLQKPFSSQSLVQKVRKVLDEK